jgi:hypothetical protein
LRLFAYALLGALAMCDSAWCAEEASAIEELKRAVTDLRRSGGLYDPRQFVLLNQLVELHSLQGDIDAALEALAYMETVSERREGPRSPLHAVSLAGIGTWHCRLGKFDSGRERFRRSINWLRAAENETLIHALLGLARCSFYELAAEGVATSPDSLDSYRGPVLRRNRMSIGSPAFRYRVHKILRPEGDQALRQAAQLVENATTMAPERRVAVLLQIGDWFQAKDHSRTARRYYASAQRWVQRTVVADDPFAAPVQVLYPVPSLALRGSPARESSAPERYVEIEFTVRADGRIDRERVLTREPGKSAADETLQALQVARYRPRMVDGAALDTAGVRFRQVFK